jgi:hypothetical protein
MKKHFNDFKKLSFLCLTVIFSISCESDQTTEEKQETTNDAKVLSRIPSSTNFDFDVAWYYAPHIHQDMDVTDGLCSKQSVNGSGDWIARVDYDGDWNTKNNWENMSVARGNGTLNPVIYYNVAVTETQFYVLLTILETGQM